MKRIICFIKKNSDLIGYICLALFFVYMNIEIYRHLELSLESDMSSELVLAKILAEEKSLITTSWFYSTEIRFLNTNLIFTPLFMLTENWRIVRMAGMMIIELILFLAYYYVARSLDLKHIPWIGFLITGAISKDYYKVVILDSCYAPHLIIALFSIGLLINIYKNKGNKKNLVRIAGLMLLALSGSIEGIRLPFITYLPLFAAAILICFFNQLDNLKEGRFDFKEESLYLIKITLLTLISSFAGLVINRRILPQMGYLFKLDGVKIGYKEFSFYSLGTIINGWLSILGYQSDDILVFTPVQLIIKPLWAVMILLLIYSTYDMIFNHKKYDKYELALLSFYLSSACIISLLFVFTDAWYRDRYFLPISVFAPIVIGIFLKHYKIDWQKAVYIAVLVGFIVVNTRFQIRYRADNNEYAAYKEINTILLDNDCFEGISDDHWEGHNILTELSNGKIETYRLYGYGSHDYLATWLQLVDHSWKRPSGKTYLITGINDEHNVKFNTDVNAYIVYQDEMRTVYVFDDYDQLESYIK